MLTALDAWGSCDRQIGADASQAAPRGLGVRVGVRLAQDHGSVLGAFEPYPYTFRAGFEDRAGGGLYVGYVLVR